MTTDYEVNAMNSKQARRWIVQMGWRLLLVGLLVLPASLWGAPSHVTAGVPRSEVAPLVGIFTAWAARNRVYRTANAYVSSTGAYYDRLHAKAREQLETRALGGMRQSQVAAYVKVVVMIERERAAMTQFAESEKRAARGAFIDKVNNTVVDIMLSTTAATRALGAMQKGISSSKGFINGALDQLAGGGGGVLADVQQVRQTAEWVALGGEIVGGKTGAQIRALGNGVVRAINRPTEEIQAGLEQVSEDLGALSGLVGDLQARGYLPSASEIGRDALISVVTGESGGSAADALVDLLSAKAGHRDGGFRGRARAALAGHVQARCAAVGARYREVLFRLQAPAADSEVYDTLEVPPCNVIDLDALAAESGEPGTDDQAPVADEPAAGAIVTKAPAAESAEEAAPEVEEITPEPVAEDTPEPEASTPAPPVADEDLDPCAVMPAGGSYGRADETSCFATFSTEVAIRTVQINVLHPGVQPQMICQSMEESSDYHTVMSTWPVGLCGYVYDRNYLGEKVPGYTGWSLVFVLDQFSVLVTTKEEYPANKAWVESTAAEIEESIRAYRGLGDP